MNDFQTHDVISYGDAPFFVFCDHAGNSIPEDLCCLGIPADILKTHIAWDPGAADLSRAVAQKLQARLLLCRFSRLLIDPNRSTDRADLIVEQSDQIPIPGNKDLDFETRCARIRRFFDPYHAALDAELSSYEEDKIVPFVMSIHSFTPRLMGSLEDRPWHLGVLWRHDEPTARAFMAEMRVRTDYVIGDNEPYNAQEFNYSIDRHIAPRRLKHLTLEARQDLLEREEDVDVMAASIVEAVTRL